MPAPRSFSSPWSARDCIAWKRGRDFGGDFGGDFVLLFRFLKRRQIIFSEALRFNSSLLFLHRFRRVPLLVKKLFYVHELTAPIRRLPGAHFCLRTPELGGMHMLL